MVGWWGFLVEGTEFVFFVLELFVAVAAKFAVGAWLVRATVSGCNLSVRGLLLAHLELRIRRKRGDLLGQIVGSRKSFVAMRADVWSLLGVCPHVPSRPGKSQRLQKLK